MSPFLKTGVPSLVWWLIIGTGMANLFNFSCFPFLAIILARKQVAPIYIGTVLGVAPFFGLLIGFYCARFSDFIGRRWFILIALFLWALSFFLFAVSSDIKIYWLLSGLLGISQFLFEPASQALILDLVDKRHIEKVFRMRYLVLNIGFVLGPFLGALLFIIDEKVSFYFATGFFLIYSFIIAIKIRNHTTNKKINDQHLDFCKAIFMIIRDKKLFYFTLGGCCVAITYSQFESVFPQFLFSSGYSNFIYVALLMVNGVGVLVLQAPIYSWTKKLEMMLGMRIGGLLIFVGYVVISLSVIYFPSIFFGMLIVTIGELLISPIQNTVINHLSEINTRGLYFGAYNFRQLGFSFGPIIGGYFFEKYGGFVTFLLIGLFGIFASCLFAMVQKTMHANVDLVAKI